MQNGSVRILAIASLLGSMVLSLEFAWAEQRPTSAPTPLAIQSDVTPSPLRNPAQARDSHLAELRSGLERLARTYPSNDAYMDELRLGLERLARNINSGGS